MAKISAKIKKAIITLGGWAVLLIGIVMIPYPGPGWVVVFIGLSILAKEFEWAQDLHDFVHDKYQQWQKWLSVQPNYIKIIFWILTAATVVVTIWLLNGYGMINQWLDLKQDWVISPLFSKS